MDFISDFSFSSRLVLSVLLDAGFRRYEEREAGYR
jgi:hypothetical protein